MSSFDVYQIGEVKIDQDSCYIKIYESHALGLRHIEKFGHIIVLWWISMRDTPKDRATILVTPPRLSEPVETGVFSSRSHSRLNPIFFTNVFHFFKIF